MDSVVGNSYRTSGKYFFRVSTDTMKPYYARIYYLKKLIKGKISYSKESLTAAMLK